MLRRRKATADGLARIEAELEGYELPTFSQHVTAALQELGDPDVDLRKVAAILSNDPGMSVYFLRLANSASFGLRSGADTLDRAIAMLGRNQVESILIGRGVSDSIQSSSPLIDQRRFWATAATRAVVAAHVSDRIDPGRRSEHFTAALLQDMALPVLVDIIGGYDKLLVAWYEGSVRDLAEAELEEYGWDHASAGAMMCRTWGFPENLVEAVRSHHEHGQPPSPGQLVGAWHEVDDDAGPAALTVLAGEHGALADRVDEVLNGAMAGVDEVVALFV